MLEVRVCGPRDKAPDDAFVINTTSRSKDYFGRNLSPFFLGPVSLWGGHLSLNVENGWQYSKVYAEHVDENNEMLPKWFEWAQKGWNSKWASRYPMGKGRVPMYSYWDGEKLGYIEARKRIYCPLYYSAVTRYNSFALVFRGIAKKHKQVWLWDFDGYDHVKYGMTLRDVINNPKKKMGHAFVIAMIITEQYEWL